jgi:hypothetical protein
MSERTERLIFLLNKNDLRQVEEFVHANQIPSRAAAIRELLRRGLQQTFDQDPSERRQSVLR